MRVRQLVLPKPDFANGLSHGEVENAGLQFHVSLARRAS